MKNFFLAAAVLFSILTQAQQIANPADYLKDTKTELAKLWPQNRTINLVFHGHSVPTGYFKTPDVKTLSAYPHLLLKALKELYPYAVINVITTSIGGEQSRQGSARFEADVLTHKPDVLFIDYALNDRGIGLEEAKKAWTSMIEEALKKNIRIILLTPTPDQSVKVLDNNTDLDKHTAQITELAKKYNLGLTNSYALFKKIALSGDSISRYMSQVNHPNERGHTVVANDLLKYFK